MKQLSYAIRYLLRGRGNNVIKVISLTLGLIVSLILFSQVAFELSYDNFYPDVDRLYSIQRKLTMLQGGEEEKYDGPVINAPVPGAMKDDISGVEDALVTTSWSSEPTLLYGEKVYTEKVLIVDSTFFDVFGYRLLEGDKKLLGVPSHIFLTQSAAKRIFGSESPVGKTLLWDKKDPVTVAGVFEDVPDNCHLDFDAVIPFKTLTDVWGARPGWMNNDAYFGYVKLRPGVTPEEVEAKIPGILYKYYDVDGLKAKGMTYEYFLKPVKDLHATDPTTERMIHILSALAFALLIVSGMNYVLISISSLSVKAKMVGVHKCNGASSGDIFSLFIYETVILVLTSLILSVVLIVAFRTQIEGLIQASLVSIFSFDNLWVAGVVVVSLILIAGIIPARIFCTIPVTQVFRTYATNKKIWKKVLLFVQFAGIAFMMTFLLVIIRQYHLLLNKNMGYTTENVVYSVNIGDVNGERIFRLKDELKRLPQVVSASVATSLPINGMSGCMIGQEKDDNFLFSSRFMYADKDYVETFQVGMREGDVFYESKQSDKVLVNEDFVRRMNWEYPVVGKIFYCMGSMREVVGVMKDFQLASLYAEQMPLVIFQQTESDDYGTLILRVDRLTPELKAKLDTELRTRLNKEDTNFESYRSQLEFSYQDARLFRNSIFVASGIMLVITLLGLLGYTEDEIHRRSKEIAIRKVNGARAVNILTIMSKGISLTSIPAIIVGILFAYKIGADWLMQFAVKIPLTFFLFFTGGIIVLAIIVSSITVRAWKVANENPVNSLKSE